MVFIREQESTFGVNRIRTTFRDDIGNVQAGHGTGFWVGITRTDSVFVTNRHNVDPDLKWPGQGYELVQSEIEVRRFSLKGEWETPTPHPETRFFSARNYAWKRHPTADCALIPKADLLELPDDFLPFPFCYDLSLPTEWWIQLNVAEMEVVSFIGFPSDGGKPWWDEKWNIPIARLASLASPPSMTFTNGAIQTADVGLISGLSFGGSSGSPLIVHAKGQMPSLGEMGDYRPKQLLGIVSGHFKDSASTPAMFRHSGLPYYTRAPSIRELMGLDREGENPYAELGRMGR
jgi:hypothetical protein